MRIPQSRMTGPQYMAIKALQCLTYVGTGAIRTCHAALELHLVALQLPSLGSDHSPPRCRPEVARADVNLFEIICRAELSLSANSGVLLMNVAFS